MIKLVVTFDKCNTENTQYGACQLNSTASVTFARTGQSFSF